jgi:signal peptidase II
VFGRWLFLLIAAVVIALDQITKHLIRINIPVGTSLEEVWHFSIVHITNTGGAFGLFPGQAIVLTVFAFIGLIVIFIFYRQISRTSLLATIALGLIFGGAIGNQIDRIQFGAVTDFIYVRLWGDFYWPAFNVADAAISTGMVLLIWFIIASSIKKDESQSKAGQSPQG